MATRAALAKVSRPRLFGVVARERLFNLLDDNAGRPLIWIDGPPGAGKTTLVASYVEQRAPPCLWYLVEPSDADPASFFHYLAIAARDLIGHAPADVPRFVPDHAVDLGAFSTLFFRAFFAQLPSGTIVVLDNFQEAGEDSSLHDVVSLAVQEMPAHCSFVAISRECAPARFIRHAARGALLSIGWEQLKFTFEELRDVSAQRNVSDKWLLEALHRESQGWAAGVTLMLERLNHLEGAVAHELPSETRESVFNYFASLLFEQATGDVRHILMSIAFLPRVTGTLARKLSGRDHAGKLLEELYRRRMFTDRRPGAEPVYQFHALFLDFLRAKAQMILAPEALDELLRCTAGALEGVGDIDASVDVWKRAQAWDECVRVAIAHAALLLNQGRRQTVMRWLSDVPEVQRSREPWALYWLGRAQLQTQPQAGLETLRTALEGFRQAADREGRMECLTALLNGSFLGFHALDAMDPLLDQLLVEVETSAHTLSPDAELRVTGVLCVTLFHVRPWHPLTSASYQRIEALLPHCTDPSVALVAAMAALVVSGLCGDFERGDRIVGLMEPFVLVESASPSDAAWSFAQVGWLRFMEGRYEDALRVIERGLDVAHRHGLRQLARQLLFWRFTVEWRAIGWQRALATLTEIDAIDAAAHPMSIAQLSLYKARAAGHARRCDEALRCSERSQQWALRIGSRLQELVYSISNADIHLEMGRPESAVPMMRHARALVESAPVYECFMPAILFLEARLAFDRDDSIAGLRLLRDATDMARKDNHRFYLRFCDWAMPRLFAMALEACIAVDLVTALIRTFRLRPPAGAPDCWPWPVRVITLGRFEVQVNGEALEYARKLPRKTLLLLKAILAQGHRNVSEQVLCDSLWADEEGDAASNALSITVLRLRKLLGSSDAVIQKGGKVWLNPELCWVDAWAFEDGTAPDNNAVLGALPLYKGEFLAEDEGETWTVTARERLRGKFIHALSEQGARLEHLGDPQAAIDHYLRGIEADPVVESFYQGLMRCYERLDRRSEAFAAYRRLKHTLSVVLGVPPSESTQQLFQRMLQDQRAVEDAKGGRRTA